MYAIRSYYEKEMVMANLSTTTKLEDLACTDYVIEAAPELLELKQSYNFV